MHSHAHFLVLNAVYIFGKCMFKVHNVSDWPNLAVVCTMCCSHLQEINFDCYIYCTNELLAALRFVLLPLFIQKLLILYKCCNTQRRGYQWCTWSHSVLSCLFFLCYNDVC